MAWYTQLECKKKKNEQPLYIYISRVHEQSSKNTKENKTTMNMNMDIAYNTFTYMHTLQTYCVLWCMEIKETRKG